jgi:hypothetical protein
MHHITSLCHIPPPTISIGVSKVITPLPSIHYGMTFEMTGRGKPKASYCEH